MPSPADQLPSGPNSLAQKIARLERAVSELRATKRAAHTTVTDGKVTFSSPAGWQIVIDPTSTQPVIYFNDPSGALTGAINATGDPTRKGIDVSSGPFSDGTIDDWRWVSFAGQTDFGDSYNITRARDSDPNTNQGGWFFLDADTAQFGINDTINGTDQLLQINAGIAVFDQVRAIIDPPASTNPGLLVSTAAGHTGYVYGGIAAGTTVFTVDTAGNLATAGQMYAQTLNIGSGASAIGGDLTVGGNISAQNIQTGQAMTPTSGGTTGTWTSVGVTFAHAFTTTPRVVATANSNVSAGTTEINWSVTSVTTAGFQLRSRRTTDSSTTFDWIAIG
jgi:hypothetical protein